MIIVFVVYLDKLFKQLRFSQNELGKKVDIPVDNIGHYEVKSFVQVSAQIADILHLNPNYSKNKQVVKVNK